MNPLRDYFATLCRRLDALSLRERQLLGTAFLLVVVVLWYTLLMEPLAKRRQVLMEEMDADSVSIAALEVETAAFVAAGAEDPEAELLRQKALLEADIGRLDQRLGQMTGDLINPQQMVLVLEEMLKRCSQLSLDRLQNLPAEALLEQDAGKSVQTRDDQLNLYRHALRMELTGNYLQALAYLQLLEELPRKVFWQNLTLTVEEYPTASIRVTIYTLSLKKDWIGV